MEGPADSRGLVAWSGDEWEVIRDDGEWREVEEASPSYRVAVACHRTVYSRAWCVGPASCWPPDPVDPLRRVAIVEVYERLYEVKRDYRVACTTIENDVRATKVRITRQSVSAALCVKGRPARVRDARNNRLIVLVGDCFCGRVVPGATVLVVVHVAVQADE